MKKTIAVLILISLVLALSGCGGKGEERSLTELLSRMETQRGEEARTEPSELCYIKIKKRVACFGLVDTGKLKIEDYLGELYRKEGSLVLPERSPETQSWRLYRVVGETDQRYLIAEEPGREWSLWHFQSFFTEPRSSEEKALAEIIEEAFRGCDLSPVGEKELRKLIQGTGHELLIASAADVNAVFQARAHLDALKEDSDEDSLILGHPKEEMSALKLGTPCSLYCFNGKGEKTGDTDFICPVLYEGAIAGIISLSADSGGKLRCALARSFGPALEELRFSQSLDFESGIILAEVEDKVIVTDGEKTVILEDRPAPGRPSIDPEKLDALAPLIREAVTDLPAEITRSLG